MPEQIARTAELYIGRLEVGTNRGAWVDGLNRRMKVPLGSPWCATFACGCVLEVKDRFSLSKINIEVSASVKDLWNKNPLAHRMFPERGMIACFGYKGTINGHCGIVVAVDPKGEWFETVEGNADDKNTTEREGVGVFKVRRPMKQISQSNFYLLGFLKAV